MTSITWNDSVGLDLVQDRLGVLQAVGHADPNVVLADGHVDLAKALDSADLSELQAVGRLAGDQFSGGAESGLHHAPGGAKNVARPARQAQRGVELAVGQQIEIDAVALDHPDQLARRQHGIGERDHRPEVRGQRSEVRGSAQS